ncbi:MAG: mechanosensitive ion channel protein, partial [Cyanobacteriota bacterium]|nr:mechanosensitive ion channel protein [Cyanobacteriota bacterium]
MWNYRVRAIILAGVACVFAIGITPARSQEQPEAEEAEKTEAVQPAPTGNPEAATTTEEVDIPVDELELIVKPFTLAELQNEAAGWMLLLKTK